ADGAGGVPGRCHRVRRPDRAASDAPAGRRRPPGAAAGLGLVRRWLSGAGRHGCTQPARPTPAARRCAYGVDRRATVSASTLSCSKNQMTIYPSSNSPLIVEDLDLRIGSVNVVRHLNLAVGRGEFWGLLGPNGVGKTTLLKALAGVFKPERGGIRLDGQRSDDRHRRDIARR